MNTREKRLMMGLLTVLLCGIAYLGFDQLNGWKRRLDVEARKLEITKVESEEMLAQEKLWNERSGWLTSTEPAYGNRKDAELALLKIIEESMGNHSVTKKKTQPTDPVELDDMIAATMIVEGSGDLEKVMAWLHDLQKPSAFLSIPTLRMLPDQEDTSKVLISLNLQKWFRKTES